MQGLDHPPWCCCMRSIRKIWASTRRCLNPRAIRTAAPPTIGRSSSFLARSGTCRPRRLLSCTGPARRTASRASRPTSGTRPSSPRRSSTSCTATTYTGGWPPPSGAARAPPSSAARQAGLWAAPIELSEGSFGYLCLSAVVLEIWLRTTAREMECTKSQGCAASPGTGPWTPPARPWWICSSGATRPWRGGSTPTRRWRPRFGGPRTSCSWRGKPTAATSPGASGSGSRRPCSAPGHPPRESASSRCLERCRSTSRAHTRCRDHVGFTCRCHR
mmetsp:Transcript_141678/g.452530  ORF Transcript_141678/g.452530 Transcript_141678/m.452530 type:complete len:274 (+) Transcript_141678:1313-2134(+)